MAGALRIKSGARLQMAFDAELGEEPKFNMVSTFAKSLDESAFLVSIPMKNGKPLPLDENQKILFSYGTGIDKTIMAGYADDIVKDGIRKYWKIRRVTEQRQFFERKDERYKVALRMDYSITTWIPDEDGVMPREDAMTLDISSGGVAVFLNRKLEVGEICDMTLPRLGSTEAGHKLEHLMGVVCWLRDAPRGSIFRNLCGVQFRFEDEVERQRLADYLLFMKKKYKL